MKRICFITTIPGTLRAFVLRTAIFLHENTDWDISFISSYDEDFAAELPEYIHYFPVKMERGISISGIKALFEMKKIFDREKFDMIQYSTPNASLYASIAGWLARIPVRLYCQWGMVYISFSGLKRCIFKSIEKMVCYLSTWIEPDSYSNLKFAHNEKLYPVNKGSVVWNGSACGVNLGKFDFSKKQQYRESVRCDLKIKENDFVFCFVGRTTRDKGVNELLSSFKTLKDKYDDIYLIMVGRTEENLLVDAELMDWATKSDNVIFTGYTRVVEQYLSAADVYVLPSYREGFGMSVIEAEAMGVPVIVSDIPGPTDAMIEAKTGMIVEKKNVEMLIQAMETFYNDRTMVENFGNNAHNFAVSQVC